MNRHFWSNRLSLSELFKTNICIDFRFTDLLNLSWIWYSVNGFTFFFNANWKLDSTFDTFWIIRIGLLNTVAAIKLKFEWKNAIFSLPDYTVGWKPFHKRCAVPNCVTFYQIWKNQFNDNCLYVCKNQIPSLMSHISKQLLCIYNLFT